MFINVSLHRLLIFSHSEYSRCCTNNFSRFLAGCLLTGVSAHSFVRVTYWKIECGARFYVIFAERILKSSTLHVWYLTWAQRVHVCVCLWHILHARIQIDTNKNSHNLFWFWSVFYWPPRACTAYKKRTTTTTTKPFNCLPNSCLLLIKRLFRLLNIFCSCIAIWR